MGGCTREAYHIGGHSLSFINYLLLVITVFMYSADIRCVSAVISRPTFSWSL